MKKRIKSTTYTSVNHRRLTATQRVFPRRKKTQGKEQTVLFDLFRPGLFQRWIDGGQNSPSGKKEKREKNERVLYDSPWDMWRHYRLTRWKHRIKMATGKKRDEGERGEKKTVPVAVTIYHIYSKIRVAEMNDPFYNHTFFFNFYKQNENGVRRRRDHFNVHHALLNHNVWPQWMIRCHEHEW